MIEIKKKIKTYNTTAIISFTKEELEIEGLKVGDVVKVSQANEE